MSIGGLFSDLFSPVYFVTALKNGWLILVRPTFPWKMSSKGTNLPHIIPVSSLSWVTTEPLRSIPAKIPSLSNYLFAAAGDRLSLTATDLDLSLRTSCIREVSGEGAGNSGTRCIPPLLARR